MLQSEHRDADQNQLKMILMEQVKRDAVEELFGSVRIKGKPTFYNSKN